LTEYNLENLLLLHLLIPSMGWRIETVQLLDQ